MEKGIQIGTGEWGWYDNGLLFLPKSLRTYFMQHLHSATHLGKEKIKILLGTARLHFLDQPTVNNRGNQYMSALHLDETSQRRRSTPR